MNGQSFTASGTINSYYKVSQVLPGQHQVLLNNNQQLAAGDRILLIQMKGAVIDDTNNPSFGTILNYNHAGRFELGTICSTNADTVTLKHELVNQYDASGKLQLIKVPSHSNITINDTVTAPAWDNDTGGVVVLEAEKLNLNAPIDVDGKGFRGGYIFGPDTSCNFLTTDDDYFYSISSTANGMKGEGIADYTNGKKGGRGALANGGGGGNNHNSGGAGGGNLSKGGKGGEYQNNSLFQCNGPYPGVGGKALDSSGSRLFFGGGGGAGHENNNPVQSAGANGGGIVILKADTLVGNSQHVSANGLDANTEVSDGAGGGGAGGSVLVESNWFNGNIEIQAKGGDGGDVDNGGDDRVVGPGGGGSGGAIMIPTQNLSTPNQLPSVIDTNLAGGNAGISFNSNHSQANTSVNGQDGTYGHVNLNKTIPESQSLNFVTCCNQLNLTPDQDTSICQTDSLNLNITSGYNDYLWSTGDTTTSINVSSTGSYWVEATDNFCVFNDTVNIDIDSIPQINLGQDTTLCQGDTLLIEAGDSAQVYNWSNGGSAFSAAITQSGTYSLEASNGNCYAYDTIQVNFDPTPQVDLGNDTSLCIGDSIILDAGNASSYQWSTGDTTRKITVDSSGSYNVQVGNGTCEASDTILLQFNAQKQVDLGPDSTFCYGDSVVLLGTSSNYQHAWSTGSSDTAIKVGQSGAYWLTVGSGDCQASDTVNLDTLATPNVNLGQDTSLCSGDSITLDAGIANNYQWSTGDTKRKITVDSSGSYNVQVGNGTCEASDTILLQFNTQKQVDLGPDTTICEGDTIQLSSGIVGQYTWSNGSNASSIPVYQSGLYWVDVTQNNCTYTDSVIISSKTPPSVNLGKDTTICGQDSLVLNAGSTGNNYQWSTGASGSSTTVKQSGTYWVQAAGQLCNSSDTIEVNLQELAVNLPPDTLLCDANQFTLDAGNLQANHQWSTGANNSSITVSQTGNYWVEVEKADCKSSDTTFVQFASIPKPDFKEVYSICSGEALTLNYGNSNYDLEWSSGDTSSQTQFINQGVHYLEVSKGSCRVRDSFKVNTVDLAPLDLGPDTTACIGDSIKLKVKPPNANYLWSNGSISRSIKVDVPGLYQVTVTRDGCERTDEVDISYEYCAETINVYLPNAFTPNDDGLNDEFKVRGDSLGDFELKIYNRWGEQVYKTTDPQEGWDGTHKGEIAPQGTYIWMLKAFQGNLFKKGRLFLLR